MLLPSRKTLGRLLRNARMQGAEIQKSEAYFRVRRNDEDKGNAADGRFWEASLDHSTIHRYHLTGNIRSLVRAQESNDLCYFFRKATRPMG